MKVNDVVAVESSTELAWLRLPEPERRRIASTLAQLPSASPNLEGRQRGVLEMGGFNVVYEFDGTQRAVTVVSVATEREVHILRR